MTDLTRQTAGIAVQVMVGGLELIHSGLLHMDGETEVSISIGDLKYTFVFKSDAGGARYESQASGMAMTINLFNFNNSLGEGKLKPIQVGYLNDRKLYLTFFGNTLVSEGSIRRFEYAFYFGERV